MRFAFELENEMCGCKDGGISREREESYIEGVVPVAGGAVWFCFCKLEGY